jgi:hypothetical protein
MFQTIFEKFSGFLDQRFIVSVWIPSLFFWVALLCLIAGWAGSSVMFGWWKEQPFELQILITVLLLAWITFFARLLLNLLGSLVRIYEGYWKRLLYIERLPFFDSFTKGRKRYYAEKIAGLKAAGSDQEIYLRFPPATRLDEVMPTRMGNILKNGEIYPQLRYGMDAVLIWPRLYSVLPESIVRNFGSAAAELELMLVISALGATFACVGGTIAMVLLPWYIPPACILCGALVAWLGYEGAVRSALSYNHLIKAAFDLHRGTLLKTIGWFPASSYDKEKSQWNTIAKLWYQGPPPTPEEACPLGYEAEKTETEDDTFGYLWLKSSRKEFEACLITSMPKEEKPKK